jgi:flagellar P-ring protein precursor FlgI
MCALIFAVVPAPCHGASVRIKDITRVHGARDNQLIGYGLVIGLRGSGDSRSTPFTARSLANMLDKFGIAVDAAEIRARNVAAVMVTATLPAFAKPGDRIDVLASSLGDAKSILGGTLLLTELAGADGRVYAVAQGPVITGADSLPTVARVPSGATVEGYVEMNIVMPDGSIVLSLLNPDYATATRIAQAIASAFGNGTASAVDAGTVRVSTPPEWKEAVTPFLAELGALQVTPDAPAKVVLNSRTGLVVIGANVRVSPAAVSYGGFRVQISTPAAAPAATPAGAPTDGQLTQAADGAAPGSVVLLEAQSTIQALVDALNAVGARPQDIMSIMEALRACGALQAELEVI